MADASLAYPTWEASLLRCPLTGTVLLLCVILSVGYAQEVKVEYFAADPAKAIDLNAPDLKSEMLDLGIVIANVSDNAAVMDQVLAQTREKPVKAVCYAVRITNQTGSPIPLSYDTVNLASGTWQEVDADFTNPTFDKASPVTEWAGAKSIFAKGKTLADGATVDGVVFYELPKETASTGGMLGASMGSGMDMGGMMAAAPAPQEPPRRIQYVAPASLKVKAAEPREAPDLLQDLDLEWTSVSSLSAPPGGKPRIFPGMGNVDDNTPLRVGTPGALKAAPKSPVEASVNLVGEQPAAGMGGMPGMSGMGGSMDMMGMPSGMPGMPGMPGMGGGMPGMPGAPGGPEMAPGAPSMPGEIPETGGKRPRRPGAGPEE